jgi:hypothetical protein
MRGFYIGLEDWESFFKTISSFNEKIKKTIEINGIRYGSRDKLTGQVAFLPP